ncbi:MAG: polyprenyl synthetase family protein [Erysipelotrichaceae bacterium]|nr:polyprenyl synthetase family protein [Erysipelotrichaceae bacterium]
MKTFDQYIDDYFTSITDSTIKEAMRYALQGGKRLRSSMIFDTIRSNDKDPSIAYPFALALEMIHSYSLVHDDLPCMDNDLLRRGKPSTFAKYGEANGLLAGDALLTEAFKVSCVFDNPNSLSVVAELSKAAGANGMVYGQFLDLSADGKDISLEQLKEIEVYKTGKLFTAALRIGAILSGDDDLAFYDRLGCLIGEIFQIQDDLLDVTKTTEELGKPALSDIKNNKSTILSFMSIEKARLLLNDMYAEAERLFENKEFSDDSLYNLVKTIENREC